MNLQSYFFAAFALARAASLTGAVTRAEIPYQRSADVLDAGGSAVASANYSAQTSVGGVGGVSAAANGTVVAKTGFAGQLFEVTVLALVAPPVLDEGSVGELVAEAQLDDLTHLRARGPLARWKVVSGPIAGLAADGRVTAGMVYQDTPATVSVVFQSLAAVAQMKIRNVGDDDFGLYAHDGLPDAWQVQHFGENHPLGIATADFDGDGQSNDFEYHAGLSPTDPQSRFALEISAPAFLPGQKALLFGPILAGRQYTIECSTDLSHGQFTALTNTWQFGFENSRLVVDRDPTEPGKFYRVRITGP